eukprot:88903-Pyramimonas_sp.AAC.2
MDCSILGVTNDTSCQAYCNTTFSSEHGFSLLQESDDSTQSTTQTETCFCRQWWNGTAYRSFGVCSGTRPYLLMHTRVVNERQSLEWDISLD